ncbi:MAG: GNAT family N-acetyltransferase [Anaerolineae bacterium]|nr:MAG: GNAT family N-acetyltransferase [Anaerolineae bacterium]
MAEIQVRSLSPRDVATLSQMDSSYHTDFVWQMDLQAAEKESQVRFREIRLPRTMRVETPRDSATLAEDWKDRPAVLVAERDDDLLGYASLTTGTLPGGVLVTELVVARRFRRQGAATALLRAAQTWAGQHNCARMMIEMQSKNYPAICMAQKLGFEFCGYNDRYYSNRDIAVFFARNVG